MITVSWYDFDAQCERWGKLLQVGAPGSGRDPVDIGYVITDRLASDKPSSDGKPGKGIIPVRIGYLHVHGVQDAIPVLGHHQAKEPA